MGMYDCRLLIFRDGKWEIEREEHETPQDVADVVVQEWAEEFAGIRHKIELLLEL